MTLLIVLQLKYSLITSTKICIDYKRKGIVINISSSIGQLAE